MLNQGMDRAPASGGHGLAFVDYIPGLSSLPPHISHLILVSLILMFTMSMARARLLQAMAGEEGGIIPSSKFNLLNFFELLAEQLYSLTESVLGEKLTPRFFPIVGFTFIYILASNLIGSVPGFQPPTNNLNTTLAFGLFIFLYYNWVGIKEHGSGYIKQFLGPVRLMAPLMLAIELISHFVRPLTLGIRLRTNIFADHMVLATFSDMVPILVPMIFMAFGIFVAFVQALVFTLLTMVYISLAASHDH